MNFEDDCPIWGDLYLAFCAGLSDSRAYQVIFPVTNLKFSDLKMYAAFIVAYATFCSRFLTGGKFYFLSFFFFFFLRGVGTE